jgi:hypothetical protein
MPEFWPTANLIVLFKKKVIIHTHTPGGAVSKSFVLYHEPDASKSDASPIRSIGPLMAPFNQPLAVYVETTVPSIFDPFTLSSFTPSQTPPNEQIQQAVEDPLASNASLVASDQIDCEILLNECIGHGVAGQVFIGTADKEKYAIKIAPWKDGKQMLR